MADKRLNFIVDLVNKTEGGFKRIYSDLEAIEQRTENTTRFMKEMGLVGTAALAGLGLATKKFLSDAGELEQQTIAFETMLGSAEDAKDMLEDLSDFAQRTPFELQGIRGTAKQLMAMGIESDKVIPTLKALGDVSAGVSVDLGRVAYNYGQVKTQTKLTGVELKDFMRAGIPLLGALADVLGVTENEIKEMVSAGEVGFPVVEEAFKRMTSEGGQFANLMDKQSKSLNGQISNLQDNMTKLSEVIGTALLPIAKQVTDKLINVAGAISDWAEKNPELAATVLKVSIAIAALLASMGLLGLVLPRMILGFKMFGTALLGVKKILLLNISVTGIYTKAKTALTTATTVATLATKKFIIALKTVKGAIIATGLGALIIALGFIIQKFVELSDVVGGFGNAFKFVWLEVKKIFYNTMKAMLEGLDALFSKIPGMGDVISDELISGFQIMSDEVDQEMTNIVANVGKVSDEAMLTAGDLANAADDMGFSLEDLTSTAEDSGEAAEEYFKTLVESVGEIRDEITDAYAEIAQATQDFQKKVGAETLSYENKVVDATAQAYEKKKELERELKRLKREDDPSSKEIDRLQDQIDEQEDIIESYKDLQIDLDEQVAERRKYLRADEIQQLTMDHEKKMKMIQKEYLEEQVKRLQKLLALQQEHQFILNQLDAQTRAKLEAELKQETAFRDRLANEKEGLGSWMAESVRMYDNFVDDINRSLANIEGSGRVKVSFSSKGSARAQGGLVQPGRTYMVGERRPELFTPETYGRIHSTAGGGGITVVFTGNHFTDEKYAEQIKKRIVKDIMQTTKLAIT
jgi:tape measure domain-containing protein